MFNSPASSGQGAAEGKRPTPLSADASQAQAVAFLERTLPRPVERIDTHAAHVFLSGDRAWKMKRAVRYRFLDFSTPEKRRSALEAELELNRRTAPGLYLGLVPLVRDREGRLALGGAGEPVEWLLEMRRFPADARLDRVAERGALDARRIGRLAREIARFHRMAAVRSDRGGGPAMRAIVEGNAADLHDLAPEILAAPKVALLDLRTRNELERRRPLLDRRREEGRVRHCHGDLHLGNLLWYGDRPLLFDCLEFDEELACTDVLYDLAFLLMDLARRGMREEAAWLLQCYNDEVWEDEGMALLPLFLSVRAAVRAKVEGLAAKLEEETDRRRCHAEAARAYLDLALRCLDVGKPRLIAIGGLSGTGKSTLARALAPRLEPLPGALVLRSDVIRKQLFGRPVTERLPPSAYREEASRRVFDLVARRARRLVEAGRSVICDAVYGQREQRRQIEEVARATGASFHAFWLEAPIELLEERVSRRVGDASDADVEVVKRQLRTVEGGEGNWRRLAADRSVEDMLREVQAGIGE